MHSGHLRVPLRGRAQVAAGRGARAAGAGRARRARARPGRAPAHQQAPAAAAPVRAGRQVTCSYLHLCVIGCARELYKMAVFFFVKKNKHRL